MGVRPGALSIDVDVGVDVDVGIDVDVCVGVDVGVGVDGNYQMLTRQNTNADLHSLIKTWLIFFRKYTGYFKQDKMLELF